MKLYGSIWRKKLLISIVLLGLGRDSLHLIFLYSFQRRKIIKRYRINATKESLERGHDVTFDEFSRFVTDTEGPEKPLNEHWRPMVELCRPCEIKYDLIGKYETLDEDARLVLDTISPNRPLKFPTQPSANNSAVIKDFYRMLKPDLLQKIYGLFNFDFRIFDYTPIVLSWTRSRCYSASEWGRERETPVRSQFGMTAHKMIICQSSDSKLKIKPFWL